MVLIKHGVNIKHSIHHLRMMMDSPELINEVSATSGISKRKLRSILNYESDFDLDMLIKISASLDVSPCELLEADIFESKYKRIIEDLKTNLVRHKGKYSKEKNKVEKQEQEIKQLKTELKGLEKEVQLKGEIIELLRGK